MKKIEDIWKEGHREGFADEVPLSDEMIEEAISGSSKSIGQKMIITTCTTAVFTVMSLCGLALNIYPYRENIAIILSISMLMLASLILFLYLMEQIKNIQKLSIMNIDLYSIVENKLSVFNHQFQRVIHIFAFSLVSATFSINLTIENDDGIFEIRKILILSVFYLFCYCGSVILLKNIHRIDRIQLENALRDLDEKKLTSLTRELKRDKNKKRWILLGISLLVMAGIAVYIIIF